MASKNNVEGPCWVEFKTKFVMLNVWERAKQVWEGCGRERFFSRLLKSFKSGRPLLYICCYRTEARKGVAGSGTWDLFPGNFLTVFPQGQLL